jgi:hypothetical protein
MRPGSTSSHAKEYTEKHIGVHESNGGSYHRENSQAQQFNGMLHARAPSAQPSSKTCSRVATNFFSRDWRLGSAKRALGYGRLSVSTRAATN